MNKQTIITILFALAAMAGQAQTTVKGHVINERGENIEYVSIGIEEDSVGVISDAQGHFTLTIPAGRKDELTFTHVSYQTVTIPYTTYADGHEDFTVTDHSTLTRDFSSQTSLRKSDNEAIRLKLTSTGENHRLNTYVSLTRQAVPLPVD